MLLGHLAVPVLFRYYMGYETGPLVGGSIFPDVLDKSLHQLYVTDNGRHIGHTLLAFVVTTLLVWFVFDKAKAKSWAAGYISHLLGDGYWLPWFYPFRRYHFQGADRNYVHRIRQRHFRLSGTDIILSLWALGLLVSVVATKAKRLK